MLFGQDRDELRRMYVDAWARRCEGAPMSPLESQIAAVIEHHPEYHPLLTEDALAREYTPAHGSTNPFLHMGLHLAVRDQIATDRPPGIRREFRRIAAGCDDAHATEHRMIDCLAECLWDAQRRNRAPDEARYLAMIRALR